VGTAEEDETNTGADELAEEAATEDELTTGIEALAEGMVELIGAAELDTDALLDTNALLDTELGTLLLDTMLEVPEETTIELLAADEATGVDETRTDDEGMASQFPKPG
jgi:hypothetical protein